jgi:nitroreductase
MDRRAFLRGIGTVTIVSAGSGSWFAYDNDLVATGDGPAFQPWKDWQDHAADGPLALVRAAVLAASPHNTQPWRFRVSESTIELILDRSRFVGALDPYLREEAIGMGCALENLLLAAQAHGYAAQTTLLPGELRSNIAADSSTTQFETVARITLSLAPAQSSDLYQAIPHRRTNRTPYDPQMPVPAAILEELRALPHPDEDVRVFLFTDAAQRKAIVDISAAANLTLYSDPKIEAASQSWLRLTRKDVQHFQDGIDITAFGLSPAMTAIAKMMPVSTLRKMVDKGQKEGYDERMFAAPLIGILAVRDRYDRAQCMVAGRLWQRAHLLATARGIAARPCSEAIERIDYERFQGQPPVTLEQLGHITGAPDWQPIFLFLMGHAAHSAPPSPRRGVGAVLTT